MMFSNPFSSLRKKRDGPVQQHTETGADVEEKHLPSEKESPTPVADLSSTTSSESDENVQNGVKDIQAASSVWSPTQLVIAYIL